MKTDLGGALDGDGGVLAPQVRQPLGHLTRVLCLGPDHLHGYLALKKRPPRQGLVTYMGTSLQGLVPYMGTSLQGLVTYMGTSLWAWSPTGLPRP